MNKIYDESKYTKYISIKLKKLRMIELHLDFPKQNIPYTSWIQKKRYKSSKLLVHVNNNVRLKRLSHVHVGYIRLNLNS